MRNHLHYSSYFRSTLTDEGIELVITLMEAKDLIGPSNAEEFDTFVRIYLVPDEQAPLQTKVNNSFHLSANGQSNKK